MLRNRGNCFLDIDSEVKTDTEMPEESPAKNVQELTVCSRTFQNSSRTNSNVLEQGFKFLNMVQEQIVILEHGSRTDSGS